MCRRPHVRNTSFVGTEASQQEWNVQARLIPSEPDFAATKERVKDSSLEVNFMRSASEAATEIFKLFLERTRSEWGITQYKHVDHHLRQFGA
jgi:hypothetical protein